MQLRPVSFTLSVLALAANLACGRNPTGPSDPQLTEPVAALIAALAQQDATVVPMERMPRESHCLSVGALRLAVDGENVYVFDYETADATNRDASTVSPDGGTINRSDRACAFFWVGPPRFYKNERVIVLYVGTNPDLIRRLEALLGKPFAAR
jgi:hypothetical protein